MTEKNPCARKLEEALDIISSNPFILQLRTLKFMEEK